jgi:hypothetical protein
MTESDSAGMTHEVHREDHFLFSCCRSLGFWRRVYLQVDADVSEKHSVSIFRV